MQKVWNSKEILMKMRTKRAGAVHCDAPLYFRSIYTAALIIFIRKARSVSGSLRRTCITSLWSD